MDIVNILLQYGHLQGQKKIFKKINNLKHLAMCLINFSVNTRHVILLDDLLGCSNLPMV